MGRPIVFPPVYREFKPRGCGYARWEGKNQYFPGRFNSQESVLAYRAWCRKLPHPHAEFLRRDHARQVKSQLLYNVLMGYLAYAEQHYPRGRGGTASNKSLAVQVVLHDRDMASKPACEFDSRDLLKIQARLLKAKRRNGLPLSRATVNKRIADIKDAIRWAAARGLVPLATYQSLQLVRGVEAGMDGSYDPPPRSAANEKDIAAVLPCCDRTVRAMVRFQQLTGARSQNICELSPDELHPLEDAPDCLLWIPRRHKLSWRKKQLAVVVGPRALEILKPFIKNRPYCFRPSRVRTRQDGTTTTRHTKDTYGRAVYRAWAKAKRAAEKAKAEGQPYYIPTRFSPHCLRHARAELIIGAGFELADARASLGHSKEQMTAWYAGQDVKRQVEVARKLG